MVNGSSRMCADVSGGSTAPGAAVVQATCNGGDSQRWMVTALGGGEYMVSNKKSALLLTTASGTDGALVTQQPSSGSGYQRWQIT